MSQSAIDLLAGTWFAAEMSEPVRRRLAVIGRQVHYADGDLVIRSGVPCPRLGVVRSGRLALSISVPGRGWTTILSLEDGDIFGWSAVLAGGVASASARAVEPTDAVVFEREPLAALLSSDLDVAAAVYRRLLTAVGRRLQATRLQLLDLYASGAGPHGEPW
jgi:CRP/FNR family cyclic AMP-dependent transcriptional regulator